MEWLNYHHLLYFWTVAREGGLAPASEKLKLSQSAISVQIRTLENVLGEKLFARSGRKLALTEMGKTVLEYAEDIFSLGGELMDTVRGSSSHRPLRLIVGIADVLPKSVVYKLLKPAFTLPSPLQLVCREDKADNLLAELAIHKLDLVLSDAPMGPWVKVKAYHHVLGESGVGFFGVEKWAHRYRRGFPKSLNGAPFLLPTKNAALRQILDQWFDGHEIKPKIIAEVDDHALLEVFGESGKGIFAAPLVIERETRQKPRLRLIGKTDEARERFYAVSVERKIKHPAVLRITQTAREKTFE